MQPELATGSARSCSCTKSAQELSSETGQYADPSLQSSTAYVRSRTADLSQLPWQPTIVVLFWSSNNARVGSAGQRPERPDVSFGSCNRAHRRVMFMHTRARCGWTVPSQQRKTEHRDHRHRPLGLLATASLPVSLLPPPRCSPPPKYTGGCRDTHGARGTRGRTKAHRPHRRTSQPRTYR
jgi:hypothetical protein